METVLIERGVKLLIVDSIAALPRAEFSSSQTIQRQEVCLCA
jgi:hypothetical protein